MTQKCVIEFRGENLMPIPGKPDYDPDTRTVREPEKPQTHTIEWSRNKIDKVKLVELLNKGWTKTRIAEYFKCTRRAVYMQCKAINEQVVREYAGAPAKVMENQIDAWAQLVSLNQMLQEILSSHRKYEVIEDEDGAQTVRVVWTNPEYFLRVIKESREQLKLVKEVQDDYLNLKRIQDWQKTVLSVIDECDKDLKAKVVARLKKKKALRLAVDYK
jgi:hypothetical protein